MCPSVYIETSGCAFNASDSEVMSGLLRRSGFDLVGDEQVADVVILNTCTVKDRTYLDFRRRLDELAPRRVVVAGCIPRVLQQSRELHAYNQLGPETLGSVVDVVQSALRGETMNALERNTDEARLELPHERRNPAVEIVPINKGCLGACSFCQTVIARGRLMSFPEDAIVDRVARAAGEGVASVWLTSQDCGAYGLDRDTNLPRLLRRIARLPGDFRVRVGMANPDLVKLYLPELLIVMQHPRFYRFLHIPVQAGSDAVLTEMNRLYTVSEFRQIVESARAALPDVTFATDIIVGFPTETDDDFRGTLRLVEELKIPVVNRSRFSPRPGTRAARLKPLPGKVVAARSRELYALHKRVAAECGQVQVGWQGEVIAEEMPRAGVLLARTPNYTPVIVAAEARATALVPGLRATVRTTGWRGFHLDAEHVAETSSAEVVVRESVH